LAMLSLHRRQLLALSDAGSLLEQLNHLGSSPEFALFDPEEDGEGGLDGGDVLLELVGKHGVTEREVDELRRGIRPLLEREYIEQLQVMDSRRMSDEFDRLSTLSSMLSQERNEERLVFERGTLVTKVPHAQGGLLRTKLLSRNARPKMVRIKLMKKKKGKRRGNQMMHRDDAANDDDDDDDDCTTAFDELENLTATPFPSPLPMLGLAPSYSSSSLNTNGSDVSAPSLSSERTASSTNATFPLSTIIHPSRSSSTRFDWYLVYEPANDVSTSEVDADGLATRPSTSSSSSSNSSSSSSSSKKKSPAERTLPLSDCQLLVGIHSGVFTRPSTQHLRKQYEQQEYLCVSFLLPSLVERGGSAQSSHGSDSIEALYPHSSLDLIFPTYASLARWVRVLSRTNILRIKIDLLHQPPTLNLMEEAASAATALHRDVQQQPKPSQLQNATSQPPSVKQKQPPPPSTTSPETIGKSNGAPTTVTTTATATTFSPRTLESRGPRRRTLGDSMMALEGAMDVDTTILLNSSAAMDKTQPAPSTNGAPTQPTSAARAASKRRKGKTKVILDDDEDGDDG